LIEKRLHTKDIGIMTIEDKSSAPFSFFIQLLELFGHFSKESVRSDFRDGLSGAKVSAL